MLTRAIKLISAEWKISSFFAFIILVLGCLSIFVLKAAIFKIILFCIGLDVYNGYFLYLGKALKGEKIERPYNFILFGKDKNRYDFFILLVFFGSILLILKGPMILFQVLFSQKLIDLLTSLGQWAVLFNIIILVVYSAYKISLYSAVSSITYHRNEVLESFKIGIKGIWKFKLLLVALILIEISLSFFVAVPNAVSHNVVTLVFYIIPALLMFLMSCSYSLADISTIPINHNKEISVPNKTSGADGV